MSSSLSAHGTGGTHKSQCHQPDSLPGSTEAGWEAAAFSPRPRSPPWPPAPWPPLPKPSRRYSKVTQIIAVGRPLACPEEARLRGRVERAGRAAAAAGRLSNEGPGSQRWWTLRAQAARTRSKVGGRTDSEVGGAVVNCFDLPSRMLGGARSWYPTEGREQKTSKVSCVIPNRAQASRPIAGVRMHRHRQQFAGVGADG